MFRSISIQRSQGGAGVGLHAGWFWLAVAVASAGLFFQDGLKALFEAWQLPEYSHGPIIPVLSALLFLRQLKEYPIEPGPKSTRWTGLPFIGLALLLGALGLPGEIYEMPAYATIFWIWGIILISFGWTPGRFFWPPVLHLVYMLPLPGTLQIKLTTHLQLVSSEIGVWFLKLLSVPVFLDGNIIDLGVTKLHVAEACSGLRYLFPILSFSYIFAVLYKGPVWHKVVLLLAAAPITVLMNSVRIAVAGIVVQYYGLDWLEGFTHFFEGWVIFLICILILFGLAWGLLQLQSDMKQRSLAEALDLDTEGLWAQAKRIRFVEPSAALIAAACLTLAGFVALQSLPERDAVNVERASFMSFPRGLGDWNRTGPLRQLDKETEAVLKADEYFSALFVRRAEEPDVEVFLSWYDDQIDGGVHTPQICLPSSGWEFSWFDRVSLGSQLPSVDASQDFTFNRAIIQKAETRMMVYYWFQQGERKVARDMAAKIHLMLDAVRTGFTGGGMVRLTTPIAPNETEEAAEARLNDILVRLIPELPRFMPDGPESTAR